MQTGQYSVSVIHKHKVKHYKIKTMKDNKFHIGGFDFKDMASIVRYYQSNSLSNEVDGNIKLVKPVQKPQ